MRPDSGRGRVAKFAGAGPALAPPWIVALALAVPGAALGVPPLEQLAGIAGCWSETGTAGACADGVALDDPVAVAVSPDGRSVYAASIGSDAVVVLDRDPATGALTQKGGTAGCISETGTGGACTDGVALDGASGVAVAPDGRSVYVSSLISQAVAVFDRDLETGALVQKGGTAGCVSETGTAGACADGVALLGATAVAIAPDGANVYVASSSSDAVAVFDRDLETGALTQQAGTAGCVSETGTSGTCADGTALDAPHDLAVSSDGANVYVVAGISDALAIFDRDLTTGSLTQKALLKGCVSQTGSGGSCVDGEALDGAEGVAVAADGRSVYVVSVVSSALAVFDRDLSMGGLGQKAGAGACISETGTGGACTDGVGLGNAERVAVSPDGRSVYVTSIFSDAVAVFDRDIPTGEVMQKAGVGACVSETGTGGTCADGEALDSAFAVAVSPTGTNVYVASQMSDALVVFDRDPRSYDIDGDGTVEALTDGLLLLRYLFGFTGAALVTGAVDLVDCTRCTAGEIEAFIMGLLD